MESQGKEKLSIAVVGVGSLGQHHARILSDLPPAELVAVCDTDERRAAEIAGKYEVPWVSSVEDLPPLDGVVIAAPTTLHRELSERFLLQGVGVLCEKPLASELEACTAILDARDRGGAPLLVGHIEHFNPGVEAAEKRVHRPGFLEVHRLGVFVPRSLDVDVVLDLMIHDIEIALSLVGEPVQSVEAVGVNVLTDHVDICNARVTFPGGCVANLTASRISRDKVRKLRVFQPDAYVSVDYTQQSVEHYQVDREGEERRITSVPVEVTHAEPLRRELEHFLAVLRGDCRPLVSGEAARDAVGVATDILRCIRA